MADSYFIKLSDEEPDIIPPYVMIPSIDHGLIPGITVAAVDWSHEACFAGGALPSGATFKDMVDPTKTGSAWGGTIPAPVRGSISSIGLSGSSGVFLPETFFLDPAVDEFLLIHHLRLAPHGWGNVSTTAGLVSVGTGSGPNSQYQTLYATDAAGNVTNVDFRVRGDAADIIASVTAGDVLTELTNGGLPQLGCHYSRSAGVGVCKMYLNKELVATSQALASTSLKGGTKSATSQRLFAALGGGSFFSGTYAAQDLRVGRPFLHVAPAGTNLDVADLLERDRLSAETYVYA